MAYGRQGYRDLVQRNCAQARRLGERIAASASFELLAPVRLNIVCFALRRGGTEERDRLLAALLDDGRVFLTPTVFGERPGIRAAFVNWSTADEDVEVIAGALKGARAEL